MIEYYSNHSGLGQRNKNNDGDDDDNENADNDNDNNEQRCRRYLRGGGGANDRLLVSPNYTLDASTFRPPSRRHNKKTSRSPLVHKRIINRSVSGEQTSKSNTGYSYDSMLNTPYLVTWRKPGCVGHVQYRHTGNRLI